MRTPLGHEIVLCLLAKIYDDDDDAILFLGSYLFPLFLFRRSTELELPLCLSFSKDYILAGWYRYSPQTTFQV